MSPTEDDLRAALRHGESDGDTDSVSADRLITLGRAHRVQRRTRLLGAGAAGVFVAALATGGALLANNGESAGPSKSDQVHNGANAPATSPSSATGKLPVHGAQSRGTAACPATPTHQLLPGGGSPGQFGSDSRLFPEPVRTLAVCGYTAGPNVKAHGPTQLIFTGPGVQPLVDSLENAAKTRPLGACPDYEPALQQTLVFIATGADGSHERAVTATLSGPACRNMITNGTAVRYAWTPPSSFAPALRQLVPDGSTVHPTITQPGGGNQKHGSPIHS